MTQKKTRYECSIYKSRPKTCIEYPWNLANQIFFDCQFLNEKKDDLLSMEDLLKKKTEEEIGEYCVECGKCCFYGPAPCSQLNIIQIEEATPGDTSA